jgi:hypothetical protein
MRFNVTNITADLLPSAGSLPREGSEALPDAAEGGYAILFAPSPSIALFAEEPLLSVAYHTDFSLESSPGCRLAFALVAESRIRQVNPTLKEQPHVPYYRPQHASLCGCV